MREIRRLLCVSMFSVVCLTASTRAQEPSPHLLEGRGTEFVLRVDEQDGTPLEDLLIVFERLLDTPIAYHERDIQGRRVRIVGEVSVAREDLRRLLDTIVRDHGLVTWDAPAGEEPLITVGSTMRQGRGAAGEVSHQMIHPSELDATPARISGLYTTVFTLAHVDARSALSTFNPFLAGDGEHIRSMERSNALIVTALSVERLRHLRDLLQLVDAAPSTPPPPAPDPAGHDALEQRVQQLERLVSSLEARLADR